MRIPHGVGGLAPDTINETAVSVKNLKPNGKKKACAADLVGKIKGLPEEMKKREKAKKGK